jgi:hypothetical protein
MLWTNRGPDSVRYLNLSLENGISTPSPEHQVGKAKDMGYVVVPMHPASQGLFPPQKKTLHIVASFQSTMVRYESIDSKLDALVPAQEVSLSDPHEFPRDLTQTVAGC